MGSRNHPCCEKSTSQPSPVATVGELHVLNPVFIPVMSEAVRIVIPPAGEFESDRLTLGLPPPPNLNSVLRV